uniref:hypothetical protein n=1 Tax=Pararhizobium sp. IMCC3301 TaxID=3067904 RepID=UPI002740C90A|nr:hypothetical protein [Pararhizobium sp. IMCC3301]
MHKLLVSLAAAGFSLAANFAYAETTVGVVDFYDIEAGILVLLDGAEFVVPAGLDLPEMEYEDEVTIEFSVNEEENVISRVVVKN